MWILRYKMRMDALNRHMAPWVAVAGYGDFANANELKRTEIDFIASWAEGFGPRNNGSVSLAQREGRNGEPQKCPKTNRCGDGGRSAG